MSADLKILADNRDYLLLAEIAAWLHDMGKCSDYMIKKAAWNCPEDFEYYPKIDYLSNFDLNDNKVKQKIIDFLSTNIQILSENICFKELIEKGIPSNVNSEDELYIVRYLGRCHGAAHIEKEEALTSKEKKVIESKIKKIDQEVDRKTLAVNKLLQQIENLKAINKGDPDKLIKNADLRNQEIYALETEKNSLLLRIRQVYQSQHQTMLSTPFGFESIRITNLSSKLQDLCLKYDSNRSEFIKSIRESFNYALADTRRPTNEVTLTDWSGIVAALYKSTLAGALLLGKMTNPAEHKWRFLSIRFNSEQIWGNAQSIPVLTTKKELVTEGLDRVKILLEETYPLGNEIYRDQNNSLYVVPNIPNLLEYTIPEENKNKKLEELIADEFAFDKKHKFGFEGEVVITTEIDTETWWGQKPDKNDDSQENEIPPIAKILSNEELYSSSDVNAVENFWGDISDCGICTISWLRPQGPTSKGFNRKASDCWVNEVTGRAREWYKNLDTTIWIDEVADSNGRICLLTGRLDLLEWLKPDGYISTLKVRTEENKGCTKKPSFARMHRVWKTTKEFWEDVESELKGKVGPVDSRLKITGKFKPENANIRLTRCNAYKAMLDRIGFSIFYGENNEYLIIENLKELANKFGFNPEKCADKSPTEYLKEYLSNKKVNIYDSEGKNRLNPIGNLIILNIEEENTPYVPAIPIMAEPSVFMAIVPADKALEISRLIKIKYEKEMGKVRNRLPLSLGMVFAKSHTPLAALMDAGRKMLRKSNKERSVKEDKWILKENPTESDKSCTLKFNNGIKWEISTKMGDNITPDIWYPYFYVDGELQDRSSSFKHSFKNSKGWLVHVTELKKGDLVRILPSTFDFEFLDSASRRFEICYNENGNRKGSLKALRPYLLEEIDSFDGLWDICSKNLSNTQMNNIITLIERKRDEWAVEGDKTIFETFVHDVLYNANWNNGRKPDTVDLDELENAAKSGKLRDILELHMNILKLRAKEVSGGI